MFLHSITTACGIVSLVYPRGYFSACGWQCGSLFAFCWREMVQALYSSRPGRNSFRCCFFLNKNLLVWWIRLLPYCRLLVARWQINIICPICDIPDPAKDISCDRVIRLRHPLARKGDTLFLLLLSLSCSRLFNPFEHTGTFPLFYSTLIWHILAWSCPTLYLIINRSPSTQTISTRMTSLFLDCYDCHFNSLHLVRLTISIYPQPDQLKVL